ncbi:hypothetical protein [Cellulosimicrobium sp. KWT-B]|uniref:hypothetical protein n=1 Tax=Cellulosimicrobium sp. KWT-B TaxID=1981152 RepID=UPI000A32497C|nr:hypothetical protein [Cellulosimicrobium sp. KWT-B]
MLEELALPIELSEEVLREQLWTDGLPVQLPMRDRVDDFIARSGLDRDEVVGPVPPAFGIATVENVAVNAFMAGCRPDHLKVVVAMVSSILKDEFDLYNVQCTTNPVAPMTIVNGPIRHEIGMNFGRGCMGPGPQPNGVIGRALRFVMGNIGGSFDDMIDMAQHGSPLKYTFCFAEAEEESPWEPLHVWLGYDRETSVVTTLAIETLIDQTINFGNTEAIHLIDGYGRVMRNLDINYFWSDGNPVLIINPPYAAMLADAGFDRLTLQEALFEEARIPLEELPYGNVPPGNWTVVDGRVLAVKRPQDIYIVVAGGSGGHHMMYGGAFGLSKATSFPVSR